MNPDLPLVVVRGGGDLATGVAHCLHYAGFPLIVLELPEPRAVRLAVSAAEAIFSGRHIVEGLVFERVDQVPKCDALPREFVPVMVDPDAISLSSLNPYGLIDARLKKRNIDSMIELAPMVVGLGPGFVVGDNCHAVVETKRGHTLGRVLWHLGEAAEIDTGVPGLVGGVSSDRLLRSPCAGELHAQAVIGDQLQGGDVIATVEGQSVLAPFTGRLRGLIHNGVTVAENEKIGDLDARGVRQHCFTISDKALAIGGAVLVAVLNGLHRQSSFGD